MPYKITGTKNDTARVIVMDESDWSIESNTVISGSGSYEINDVVSGTKTLVARVDSGEVASYGGVVALYWSYAGADIFGFGENNQGELAQNDVTNRSLPTQIGDDNDWKAIECGTSHALAIKSDKTLWSWGYNGYGQLGQNDIVYYSSPVQIGSDDSWSKIFTGGHSCIAIKEDDTIWAWGNNSYNQLTEDVSAGRLSSPVQIGSGEEWVDLDFGGEGHLIVVKSDGTIWGCGRNMNGQVGVGTSSNSVATLTQIGSLTTWSKVACGYFHTLAIKTDNTMWGWGYNGYGQIGNNSTTQRSSPVQTGKYWNTWEKVAAVRNQAAGIRTNGTLWTWGHNTYGQLGIGHTTHKSSPVAVGADTWSEVSCGMYHTLAVKSDGTLWAWGYGSNGQLGQGASLSHRSSPIQVGTDEDWEQVAAEDRTSFSIKSIEE